MTPQLYNQKKEDFLQSLVRSDSERNEIERSPLLQAGSGIWREERHKLLTASNFGVVCKRCKTISCQNLVKTLLYPDIECTAMKYGKDNKINAITQFEEQLGITVEKCGFHIDKEIPFLGATPDGLIGSDVIVEVKCPESCKSLTTEEAISLRKFTFFNKDIKNGSINKNLNFFFQVQGQLHITQRAKCYFVMWTPLGIQVESIERYDEFWSSHMLAKLKSFYIDCLLPELVDARFPRPLPIRYLDYIEKAIEEQKLKEESKFRLAHPTKL